MLSRFLENIKNKNLIKKSQTILLAVSGGIDSMVMFDFFLKSDFKIAIAHCNFKLREKESEEDAIFVKLAALKNQVPFHYTSFETNDYAKEKGISIQMAARELRYEWFQNICDEYKYEIIATAHHADDNIETFLTNLTRGTGIKGLTGIKEKSGNIIRPILFASRIEIENYAGNNKIDYREDSSNKSIKYHRNFIRHEIIPKFEKLNPDFRTTIKETINRLQETDLIYENEIQNKRNELIEFEGEKVYISIKKLIKLNPLKPYLFEFLKPYKFSDDNLEKIINCLSSQSGKKFFSDTHCLIRDREYLIIYPKASKDELNESYLIDKETQKLTKPLNLSFKTITKDSNFKFEKNENKEQLDLDKLEFPLTIRKWKKGDYFYPLGMNKKKKLSDFFIDLKLSLVEKENIRLITSNNKIAWVIGYRLDNRFKITDETSKIFEIQFLLTDLIHFSK